MCNVRQKGLNSMKHYSRLFAAKRLAALGAELTAGLEAGKSIVEMSATMGIPRSRAYRALRVFNDEANDTGGRLEGAQQRAAAVDSDKLCHNVTAQSDTDRHAVAQDIDSDPALQ